MTRGESVGRTGGEKAAERWILGEAYLYGSAMAFTRRGGGKVLPRFQLGLQE